MNAFEEHTIENSISAQKRAEVKLDSPRLTAKRTVRRPADAENGFSGEFLRTLLLTLLIMAATLILLTARLTNRATTLPAIGETISGWFDRSGSQSNTQLDTPASNNLLGESVNPAEVTQSQSNLEAPNQEEPAGELADSGSDTLAEAAAEADSGDAVQGQLDNDQDLENRDLENQDLEGQDTSTGGNASQPLVADQPALELLAESDFRRETFPLARDDQEAAGMWKMALYQGQGFYQISVFPGYLAWSTLGFELEPPFRVETSTTVVDGLLREAAESMDLDGPSGYSGVMARYQDSENFYLFNIDGKGRSQLLSQINGEWTTVSPWTPTVLVNPSTEPNILAVEDDGRFVRFYVNNAPIHEVEPLIAKGLVGLAGGTGIQYASQSNFDWVRVYGRQ